MTDVNETVADFVKDYDSNKCYDKKYANQVFDFAMEYSTDDLVDDSDPDAVEHRILAGDYLFRFDIDEDGVHHVIDIKQGGVL